MRRGTQRCGRDTKDHMSGHGSVELERLIGEWGSDSRQGRR